MAGTPRTLAGPVALANGTYVTNIYNPFSSRIYGVVTQYHVVNTTVGILTFRLFKGATGANAAGTELFYDEQIPAKTARDFYSQDRFESTDFLVGGGAGAGLTITVNGFEAIK